MLYLLIMNDERQTPTYRKYAKHVGKLYWQSGRWWDSNVKNYVQGWTLVMISGLRRRWGRGCYIYTVIELTNSTNDADARWEGNYSASMVVGWIRKGMYKPVDPNNPEPPVMKVNNDTV